MTYRPPFIKQLDGTAFGGRNCTVACSCMASVRHQQGANPAGDAPWYPTPSYVRGRMGDTVGGTTLAQCDSIIFKLYGIDFDVQLGVSWADFVKKIKEGRGAVLQGSYSVLHGTAFDADHAFYGNHAIYINEWRSYGGKSQFLMYDPLADARRAGIPKGPMWIDEALLRKFAAQLVLIRTNRLGDGKAYAMFTRDTEPEMTLRAGATKFGPKTMVTRFKNVNVRSGPAKTAKIVRIIRAAGSPFRVYQQAAGTKVGGDPYWYGSFDGKQWTHRDNLK